MTCLAIEVKGGRDWSIHNRIGEAEKSHQKAKQQGYLECWTIMGVASLDMEVARRESPTTNRFYRLYELVDSESEEAIEFKEHFRSIVGIGDSDR